MVFYSAILGKVIINFGKWREFRNFLWECNCLEQIPKSVGTNFGAMARCQKF